ncbi:MAG TPA: hypothetical protein VE959_20165 [Bryobacteraceae bacterium]|nr:hypothetical protein [Bryobacteraceae bacterium]
MLSLTDGWRVILTGVNVLEFQETIMKPLLIPLIVVVIALTGPAFGGKKNRDWQTGKLVDSQRSQNVVGAVERPPVGFDSRRRTNNVYETRDTFIIETDSYTYTASEIVRGTKPANVTVNGPVKFAIDGTTMYLLDDGGKEHKADVTKKVLREASEPPK